MTTPTPDYAAIAADILKQADSLDAASTALRADAAALSKAPPTPTPPVAAFTLDKAAGAAPLPVTMTHACQNADHFQMDWGDGQMGSVHPLTDTYVAHQYTNPGTYRLSLRAWRDSDGAEATAPGTVSVATAPPAGGTVGKLYGGISLPLAQDPATDIDRIAADGFGWLRFDIRIATVSPSKGAWNWGAYDATIAHAASKGIKVNGIMYMLPSWMNGSGDDKHAPTNPQDYADWCGQAAPHLYAQGVRSMELWNEQNWGFWTPTPNRADYVNMAIRAADAIHNAEPRMIVVSGGVSTADTEAQAGHASQGGYTSPWPGCNQTLDHYGHLGLYAHVDAVGIHPYLDSTDPSPTGGGAWCEWAGGAMRTTIAIIDKWAPAGKKLTVWNTESAAPRSAMSDIEQANRVAHAMQAYRTWTLADGSPMRVRLGPYFHFTYRDWTNAAEARARTFGLVDSNYNAHPARAAIMAELAKTVP